MSQATRDALRRAAAAGRIAVDNLGLRETTVAIVVEQWPTAYDGVGSPVGTSSTTLTPSPNVVITSLRPSAFGGGQAQGASSDSGAASVVIGPITPPYPGGGYDVSALDPTPTDPSQRIYLLLSGGQFATAGEKFRVTKKTRTSLHWLIEATREDQ